MIRSKQGKIRLMALLKSYRDVKNITQRDIANTLGATERSISRWEAGDTPSNIACDVIAEFLVNQGLITWEEMSLWEE